MLAAYNSICVLRNSSAQLCMRAEEPVRAAAALCCGICRNMTTPSLLAGSAAGRRRHSCAPCLAAGTSSIEPLIRNCVFCCAGPNCAAQAQGQRRGQPYGGAPHRAVHLRGDRVRHRGRQARLHPGAEKPQTLNPNPKAFIQVRPCHRLRHPSACRSCRISGLHCSRGVSRPSCTAVP